MKNILKIALISIVCISNGFANTVSAYTDRSNYFNSIYFLNNDNFPTEYKETDPRKKTIINTKNDKDIIIETDATNYMVEQLIHVASEKIGSRYKSGGTTKDGFDCSGLMYSTFQKFNFTLPRSSHEMALVGEKVALCDAKKGDLIFFSNRGKSRINHVGMIVEIREDGEVLFVHSSTSQGVVVSSLKEGYYQRTFTQVNRVIK
jgi:murein DD-endopeptidase / murein LD-carboxypeptidase